MQRDGDVHRFERLNVLTARVQDRETERELRRTYKESMWLAELSSRTEADA
jgi:hypothetical protein